MSFDCIPQNSCYVRDLLNNGLDPFDIHLVTCNHCGGVSISIVGVIPRCEWCGKSLKNLSNQYSLTQYLESFDF